MCDLTTLRSASATSAAGAKAIQLMSTAYGHSPSVAGSLVGYRLEPAVVYHFGGS
jgi:hypothetical protein